MSARSSLPSSEARRSGSLTSVEGGCERVVPHPQAERRDVDHRAVHHPAGVGHARLDVDVGDRLGKRSILETAVAHAQLEAEGRQLGAAQLTFGPERERQLARSREAAVVARIEGRDERQHILELDALAAQTEVHRHGIVTQLGPAVERRLDGVEPQLVLLQLEAVLLKVGRHIGIQLDFGIAQQRHHTRREGRLLGAHPQIERALRRREVAAQAQQREQRAERGVRRVVDVGECRVGDAEVAHREAEGRARVGALLLRGSLRLGLLLRGFHQQPVHAAVGELAGPQVGLRDEQLAHLQPPVTEQRPGVDHHREAPYGGDGIPLEGGHTHERHPLQLERGVGEVAQQADAQPLEVEPRDEHRVGLGTDQFGNLAAQEDGGRQHDHQQDGNDRHRNFQKLFHRSTFLFMSKRNRVLPTSSNPHVR